MWNVYYNLKEKKFFLSPHKFVKITLGSVEGG